MHLRSGHAPFSQMNMIQNKVDSRQLGNEVICSTCPAAKQHRKSFASSSIKTTHPFELIDVDVWGPYRSKTHNNCNIFLTIVDDYTRCLGTSDEIQD